MKRLVIGAGRVGARVLLFWSLQDGGAALGCAAVDSRGGELFATVRKPDPRMPGYAQWIALDVTSPWIPDLPDVDVAVWSIGHDRAAGASMRSVYVDGLARVLARLRAPRLIYTSSTGIYGSASGDAVSEASPTEPDDESGRVVAEAEQTLRAVRPDAIVLRLAGLYGPGRVIGRKQVEAGDTLPGSPDRWLNVVHEEDAANAVLRAEERAAPGSTYNVVDDRPVTRGEYYAELARCMGKPAPRFTASGPSGRRVDGSALRRDTGWVPLYPTIFEGLPASL